MFENSLHALRTLRKLCTLRSDPDVLVFWLTTTMCAFYALLVPLAPGWPAAL